mgnify:CR=1 FL=1
MAKIYYDKDADLDLLKSKTIGVVGFAGNELVAQLAQRNISPTQNEVVHQALKTNIARLPRQVVHLPGEVGCLNQLFQQMGL